MSEPHRQGWCPGALRPMESGDGLIVRLRIIGGALAPDLTRALAQCAEAYGNGLIDLSARGNLQLRGVISKRLPALQARLDELGLLDADPDVEAIRNILISPLSGVDPTALCDARPSAQALDEWLRHDPRLRQLPGKFLFAIDDGGCLPLSLEVADVGFLATVSARGPCFIVHLGGTPAGTCAVDNMHETAVRAAHAFLDLRDGDERRMRDVVPRLGLERLARQVGLESLSRGPVRSAPLHILGLHALGETQALGMGIPFGRFDAAKFACLADMAEAARGELRLSPWRAIFLVAPHIDEALGAHLSSAGFILQDKAPIRAVAACPGKPACLHGAVDAQADAHRLAPVAPLLSDHRIALHVSACAKSCAHAAPAPVTLVGRDGFYDLILDGRAGDVPLVRSLSLATVQQLLPRLAATAPNDRATFLQNLFCEAQP